MKLLVLYDCTKELFIYQSFICSPEKNLYIFLHFVFCLFALNIASGGYNITTNRLGEKNVSL